MAAHFRRTFNLLMLASIGVFASVSLMGCEKAASPNAESGDVSAEAPPAVEVESLFTEVSEALGVRFEREPGAGGDYFLPEVLGGGGAFLDYDGDGDLDMYLVQGGRLDGAGDGGSGASNVLYRNDGGRFSEVSGAAGAGDTGYGVGVACADYDNDGDVDIYVTNAGRNALLRNDEGRFVDVTEASGTGGESLSTSAMWADVDRDGLLDLYVVNYVEWSAASEFPCYTHSGIRDYCSATRYARKSADRLYRNLGGDRFEDVSAKSGISGVSQAGIGITAGDYDGDGDEDLFVTNDDSADFLWINDGAGGFAERGMSWGCGYDGSGAVRSAGGALTMDLDQDGRWDLYLAGGAGSWNRAYQFSGNECVEKRSLIGSQSWGDASSSFGMCALDYDNTPRVGVYFANGGRFLNLEPVANRAPFAEVDQLYFPLGLELVGENTVKQLTKESQPIASRGVAGGDIDGDGDIDLLVTGHRGPVQLLRNDQTGDAGHYLIVKLEGTTTNRSGIGSVIRVETAGRDRIKQVRPNEGCFSSSDVRVHFGLGAAMLIPKVTVHWLGGQAEMWQNISADQVLTLRQGSGEAVNK